MSRFRLRACGVRALGMIWALALVAGPASAGYLIEAGGEAEKALDPALRAGTPYRALAEDPASAEIRWVRVQPAEASLDAATLSLRLGESLDLRVRRVDSYVMESGSLVWSGVVLRPGPRSEDFDPLDTLILVKNGGNLTGNLQYQGEWWQLRPVGGGQHVVVRIDRSRLPADHAASEREPRTIPMTATGGAAPDKADTVITVLVNYTAQAAATSADINALIDLAIAESNQGYVNSGVSIQLQLAKKSLVTYTESGLADTDRTRYQGTGDSYMGYIHTQRAQYGADVAVLVVSYIEAGDGSVLCGQASQIGSSATTAFAVVRTTNCITGNYTFAHEIGHLQSARHNIESDGNLSPYAYGHGYRFGTSWRTIMGVGSTCGNCQRLNYWSNPNKLYNGVPMGNTTRADNTRVLNTTRATVAGFKSVPSCVPDGGLDDTLYLTSCCSNYAVGGSTYCTDPADWYDDWTSCKHICGTAPVGGCIISGGVDDTLLRTSCCSGTAVPGSTFCNDPADWNDDWTTCAQVCQ